MMDTPDVTLKLLSSIERLNKILDRLITRPGNDKKLLSMRAAAKRLGVDPATTLHYLINQKQLNPVYVNGRAKIKATEVEALAESGFSTSMSPARTK